jgi:hypothetical protein
LCGPPVGVVRTSHASRVRRTRSGSSHAARAFGARDAKTSWIERDAPKTSPNVLFSLRADVFGERRIR